MKKSSSNQVDNPINSDAHFADPIKIKVQRPVDKHKDGRDSPWDFRCPCYYQRSSNFVNAGTHYGVGRNQPIGHAGNPKREVATLPLDRRNVETMRIDEIG